MRAIWKGAISFGLVNIPVGLYPATRSAQKTKLRMLRKSDHSPIHYKRVAEADDKEVPIENVIKGFEYEKGEFVEITDAELKQVRLKTTQTVDIREFVVLDQIDPALFDQPYFLAPEKGGDKAYCLLREGLRKSGKAGIAKVVIKTREHLAALKPHGKALLLELMHYPDELADPADLRLPDVETGAKELKMAETLIDQMSGDWDPTRYHDDYAAGLMELVQEKVSNKGKLHPRAAAPKPSKVVDLVAILQESIDQQKTERSRTKKQKPKKARAA